MPTTRQLMERRASAWAEMQELLNRADTEGRDLTAEERQTFDRQEGEVRQLDEDIDRHERLNVLHRDGGVESDDVVTRGGGQPTGDQPDLYGEAFTAFVRGGMGDISAEQRSALQAGFVSGQELRAQGVATTTAGGYTVPPEWRNRIVEAMVAYTPIRPYAEVITTDTGANLPWPTSDDTANEGAILAENTQVTEQDLTFGQASIDAYMYTSKMVRVSLQLLQDTGIDLPGFIGRKLGERIGRVHARHFTVGTGTAQPQGVVTGAGVGKTGATGQTTTVTWDDLIDLEHSIDPAYRNDNAIYMFHDLSLAKLRKVKDADGRYLWQPSVQPGVASTINGHRYVVNNYMAQMAANARSVLFGDLRRGYLIRDVRDIQMLRLNERYADFLQAGFLAFARADGKVQDAAAVKVYVNSAT